MKPKAFSLVFLIPVFFFMIIISCSTAIRMKTLVPAKAHKAAKLKRIAVFPFEGRRGYQISADIEALLTGIRLNNEPYFSVIERTAIDRIVKEQSLQLTGLVSAETAASVGKLLGAEGIILGTVTQYTTEDKPYTEKRSKCVEKEENGECKKEEEYEIECTERNAYVSFTPKIVDVSTGEIVASESLSGSTVNRACKDSETPLSGRREMLTKAKELPFEIFRELVAPYYVSVQIKLLTKDDSRIPSDVKKIIARGVKWTKDGRYDRACEFWNEAYKQHARGYAIPYLLGVCDEITGNLENALSYYEKADRRTGSPIREINEAIGRVNTTIAKQQILDEQLRK